MTKEVRAGIYDIIKELSDARKEIKPEILYWLQRKLEGILTMNPRYIDVLTLKECLLVRDLICPEFDRCRNCPLYDATNQGSCLPRFMVAPYDSKKVQKYIDIAKKQIKERKENGTENS